VEAPVAAGGYGGTGTDAAGLLSGFVSLVGGLVERVEALEARLASLERRREGQDGTGGPGEGLSPSPAAAPD
jgi:hypothetical protein